MAKEQPGCECKLNADKRIQDYINLNMGFTTQNKLLKNRLQKANQDNLKLENKLFHEQQKSSTLQNTINYIYEQVSSGNENVTSILKKYVSKPKLKSTGIDATSIQNKSTSIKRPKLSSLGKKQMKTAPESGLTTIYEEDNSTEATSNPLNVAAICTQMPDYNERRKMKRQLERHDVFNEEDLPFKIPEDSDVLSDVIVAQAHKDLKEELSKAMRSLFATRQKGSKKRAQSSENISSAEQTVELDNQKISKAKIASMIFQDEPKEKDSLADTKSHRDDKEEEPKAKRPCLRDVTKQKFSPKKKVQCFINLACDPLFE